MEFKSKISQENLLKKSFGVPDQPVNILDTFTLPAKTQIRSLSMSHANDMIFVGCNNREFFLFNWKDNRVSSLYHTQKLSSAELSCGAWTRNDERIAISSLGNNISIFDVKSKTVMKVLQIPSCYQVFWAKDETQLVATGIAIALQVYDTSNWEILFTTKMKGSTFGCGVCGNHAVIASTNAIVQIINLETGKKIISGSPPSSYPPNHGVAFSSRGLIAIGSFSGGMIYLMDENLQLVAQTNFNKDESNSGQITRDLSFSADGDLLIAHVDRVGVHIYSVPKLELLQSYGNSDYIQDRPIFSPDGSLYMTAVRVNRVISVLQSPFVWKERKQVLGLLLLLRELVPESVFFKDYLPLDLFRIILKLSTLLRR